MDTLTTEKVNPFFVYGTLRTGESNHGLMHEASAGRVARLDGFELRNHGLPAIHRRPGVRVIGELFEFDAALYCDALVRLDQLEGYRPGDADSLYQREEVTVVVDGREVTAWVYVGGSYFAGLGSPVASGDWTRRRAA